MDFSVIKHAMEEIASYLDHRVLLPGKNPHISVAEENEKVKVEYQHKKYVFPSEDVVILDLISLTAEILSEFVLDEFLERADIPDNIIRISAGIDEVPGQGAWSTRNLR